MISRLKRILKSGISTAIFFAVVFSLCTWFFGPLLAFGDARPLDSVIARAVTIAVLWLLALGIILLILLRRAKRDRDMADDIVEAAEADDDGELVSAEMDDLRGKLKTALAGLRKSKLGRNHLYELPWYVMIGPPGAGKTTAIINSGLQFPLSDEIGNGAIGGVGGTRNCDWWFTENAVLIDTAGRYTTQDSDAVLDNSAWLGFLGLLKKHRKRQPINGAIVAISLSDLSMQDEVTQKNHAAAIRRRLNELREKLGVRFPVYVLFTKADLIAGFTETYEGLSKEDREQVWGFTLPLPTKTQIKDGVAPVAAFDEQFGALLERSNAQLLERMTQETDHQRRSLIASFPSQIASVRKVAHDFMAEVFQDSRFENRHLLRGVYLTSGTQEGTPIDRLMMGMAQTFGIGRQAIGTGRGVGRSYFLTRLFDDVIFKESGLVSADDKVERRYRWTKRLAIAAAILAGVGLSAAWVRSYLGNQDLLAEAENKIGAYQAAAASIPGSPIGDTDLPSIVPALNILKGMPGNPAVADLEVEGRLGWGLYQGDVVGTQVQQTYRAALNQHYLPRLLLRLEEQMQANINNSELLYEALKVYLMLGLQGPMNQDLIKEWMQLDWTVSFPGASRDELRADLAAHLDVLLSQPIEQIALNGPLVEQVQALLAEMPLAERVYNGIINSPRATALPDWRLTDIGGPAITRVMVRSSGQPLSDGVEGIFTYHGFNTVFLDEALGVAKRLQRESWVLGPRGEQDQSELVLLAISRDVLDLYYNDFIAGYEQVLGDLDIIPMESLAHAVEVSNVLSGPTSPIVNVLNAIAQETKLTEDRTTLSADGLVSGAADVTSLEIGSSLSSRSQMFLEAMKSAVPGNDAEPPPAPGEYVENRFAWLHTMLEEVDGQPSQLDDLMGRLTEVYQELSKLSFSGSLGAAGQGGASALVRFQEAALRAPGPMQRWSTQIASGSSGITADGTRASINAKWQAQVLPFCTQALENRYPFNRKAKADVGLQDFSKLFAPGGLIDTFFNENLARHVDTRARPWAWKSVNNADLGISQAVLVQMQNAAEIRDAFFAAGPTPAVSFQLTPEALDPKAKKVVVEIDGQQVPFTHRQQPAPVAVQWPGSVGVASVSFEPTKRDSTNAIMKDGPWAWFRLLNSAEIRATNASDRNRVIFNVGGRIAIYQMQSGSVLNPFVLPALSKFSCPKSF